MSNLYTVAAVKGSSGWMEHGRCAREQAIAALRRHAEYVKAEAEAILSAADSEIDVRVVRGCIVQHLVKQL